MTVTQDDLGFRSATGDDASYCFELNRRTLRDYVLATWGRWDDAEQALHFQSSFNPDRSRIIRLDGRDIGLLVVDASADPYRLLTIAIMPEHQRKGLGARVIDRVIDEAAPKDVWLQVLRVNPARTLYERLGFRLFEETDTHFRMLRRHTG